MQRSIADGLLPARSRRVNTLAGVSALALLCAAANAAEAQGPTAGNLTLVASGSIFSHCTADHVSSQPGTNYPSTNIEPNLAINLVGKGNMLVGAQQDRWSNGGARGPRGDYTMDGGATWHPTSTPNVTKCQHGPWPRSSDPWVAFSPDGTAYFSSLVTEELANPNLFGHNGQTVSQSTDGGVTWGPPTTLIDTPSAPPKQPQRLNDKNSVTADRKDSNYAYVVWDQLSTYTPAFGVVDAAAPAGGVANDGMSVTRRLREQGRALAASGQAASKYPVFVTGPTFFSRTTNHGRTWQPSRVIYDPGSNNQTINNQIVTLRNGLIVDYFTFQNDLTGADQIGWVVSGNQGASFGPAHFPFDIVNFTALTPNKQLPIRSADIIFSVAVDQAHSLIYLTWQDTRFTGDNEAVAAFSPDGGNQWFGPIRVNQTPRNPTNPLLQQALIPSVTTTADGTAVVTYYDFRNDAPGATTDATDYWAVFCNPLKSADVCQSTSDWSTELRLTNTSFDLDAAPNAGGQFLGDYMGLKALGQAVWPVFGVVSAPNMTSLYTRKISVPVAQ